MRDEMSFVERVHRDLSDVRWPEPAEIRARARRRTRRTVMAAAVALLAVTVPAVVALRPTPEPVAPAAPAGRAEIPPSALLDAADLGVRTDLRLGEAGVAEPVRVNAVLEACGDDVGRPAPRPASRYSRSQTLLRKHDEDSGAMDTVLLSQDVYRLATKDADVFVTDLVGTVESCGEWWTEGPRSATAPGEVVHRWEIVDRDFAGDDALLLRLTVAPPPEAAGDFVPAPENLLVVRVGDLVTVVVPEGWLTGKPLPLTAADKRQIDAALAALARAAAQRLCVAANVPC